MSGEVVGWAFRQKTAGPSAKLVLVKLAEHANTTGYSYPGIDLIVHDTQLSERCVREQLRELKAAGLIVIIARYALPTNLKLASHYFLAVDGHAAALKTHLEEHRYGVRAHIENGGKPDLQDEHIDMQHVPDRSAGGASTDMHLVQIIEPSGKNRHKEEPSSLRSQLRSTRPDVLTAEKNSGPPANAPPRADSKVVARALVRSKRSRLPDDCPTDAGKGEAVAHWRSVGRPDLVAQVDAVAREFRAWALGRGISSDNWPALWERSFLGTPGRIRAPFVNGKPVEVKFDPTDVNGWVTRLEVFAGRTEGCPPGTWSPGWRSRPTEPDHGVPVQAFALYAVKHADLPAGWHVPARMRANFQAQYGAVSG